MLLLLSILLKIVQPVAILLRKGCQLEPIFVVAVRYWIGITTLVAIFWRLGLKEAGITLNTVGRTEINAWGQNDLYYEGGNINEPID